MNLKGEFTVEAAFIFSIFLLITAAFINLDLMIHDAVVSDTAKVIGGIEYRESEIYFRNTDNGKIDVSAIVRKPLAGNNKTFAAQQKIQTEQKAEGYFENHRLTAQSKFSVTDIGSVITAGDNAQLVRAGGKAVQIIGGQK